MILYSDTVGNFISSCSGPNPIIGRMLLDEFKANHPALEKAINEYTVAINIDTSKIVVGAKVTHKKFGEGEIVNIDKKDKYLTVRFSIGEKKFVNPDAFTKGFLEFVD